MGSALIVVYVTFDYPTSSQTFVVNEAAELKRLGTEVLLFPIHDHDVGAEQGIRPDWIMTRREIRRVGSLCDVAACFRNLYKNRGDVIQQLRLPPATLRQRVKFVRSLYYATILAVMIRRRRVRRFHLHAHFFGLMSEVAILAKSMFDVEPSASVMGHAADVVRPTSGIRLRGEADAVDVVACASEFVRAGLNRIGTSTPSVTIHCGVPKKEAGTRVHRGPNVGVKVLTVARLVEKKGVDVLLEALAIVERRTRCLASAVVVGDGPERDRLQSRAAELDLQGVHLLGFQPQHEVFSLMSGGFDAFVLPCRVAADGDSDGIPVALMEAMSCALPVLTTDTGGISELVRHGETGFIFGSEDAGELADLLLTVVSPEGSSSSVGEAGKAFVEEHFNLTREVERLREAICDAYGAKNAMR